MTKMEEAVGFDRPAYEALKDQAIEEGVSILHIRGLSYEPDCEGFYEPRRNGGATVAWTRVGESTRSKMVEVSVAWCNPKDVFCRRIGSFQALNAFYTGSTILLPIGDEDNSKVVAYLRAIFGSLI